MIGPHILYIVAHDMVATNYHHSLGPLPYAPGKFSVIFKGNNFYDFLFTLPAHQIPSERGSIARFSKKGFSFRRTSSFLLV